MQNILSDAIQIVIVIVKPPLDKSCRSNKLYNYNSIMINISQNI